MIITSRDVSKDIEQSADVVVIGSGAGGAVSAAELAEGGLSVIIVEEGGYYKPDYFDNDFLKLAFTMYRDKNMTATLGHPGVLLPLGCCVGGTTTVNSGTCFRTPQHLLRQWNWRFGLKVTARDLKPHFEAVEEFLGISEAKKENLGLNALVVKKGAEALGYSHRPLRRNAAECTAKGRCAFGCPSSAKKSMDISYIPKALKHGAILYANCQVRDIMVENGKAVGIRGVFLHPESKEKLHTLTVRAKKVILSAGAVYSPQLLKQNNLCKGSRQVGRNLFIHPAVKVMGLFDSKIEGWKSIPQGYCIDEFKGMGIIMENAFLPPELHVTAAPFIGRRHREFMEKYPYLSVWGVMVSDTSGGIIVNAGTNKPLMFYHLNKRDFERFKLGTAIMAEVFFAAGAREVYLPFSKLTSINSPDEIRLIFNSNLRPAHADLIAFHPMGTCRMGEDPRRCVVDSNLETFEVKNLYVIDASIFPSSLGVNPQESIFGFARYAAHKIIAKYRR